MRKYYIMFLFLFRNGLGDIYAQEIPVKHKIVKGETIEIIAQKYAVSTSELYELNPNLINGFKENEVIIISKKDSNLTSTSNIIYHLVQPNETKYGLSKKYNISISELERQNPQIIPMLQKGYELKIQRKASQKNSNLSENSVISSEDENYIIHIIEKGETLWELSRRYKVTVNQLVIENRSELGTYLQIGQKIKIPSQNQRNENKNSALESHLVLAGETKYGLAKRFGVTIRELENLNPQIVSMLKMGQQISIPKKDSDEVVSKPETNVVPNKTNEVVKNPEFEYHIVEVGETKYSISKKFEVSIEELERLNPQIVAVLRTGQEISLGKRTPITSLAVKEPIKDLKPAKTEQLVTENPPVVSTSVDAETKAEVSDLVSYQVQTQETLYGLSKMSGLSKEKLIELNPELAHGLKNGMIINLPSENAVALTKAKENAAAMTQAGLLKSIQKGVEKEIAFLMPFTEEKYLETIKATKKNKSKVDSNTDFYAGAMMAVDSLKQNGVFIKSKIIKIEDLKINSDNFSETLKNNIKTSKIVFSPTSDYYSDALGKYMAENNIPMLISDSKVATTIAGSTYTCLPSNEYLKKIILDYLVARNENLIVVIAPSRKENKAYILKNYPQAQFATISESGILDSESLKSLLSLTKKNYVIIDTDKSGLLLETTTILLRESTNFMVQIALLEPKDNSFDEKLSVMRFRALKMIYPSASKPNGTNQWVKFKKDFVLKNGYEPSENAIKGFDITFDALLKLYQEKEFEMIARESTTEQLHLKFKYSKNNGNGYFNSGGYILQFDEETDVKIIN